LRNYEIFAEDIGNNRPFINGVIFVRIIGIGCLNNRLSRYRYNRQKVIPIIDLFCTTMELT